MPKFYLCLILWILGILYCGSALKAQTISDLKFIPIQSKLLPSNEVRKLYQDSDGYIWIPTYNGLVRYDGYSIITYGLYNGIDESFNSYLNAVVEDDSKNLWIATEKGLYQLNKITGKLSYIRSDELGQLNAADLLFGTGKSLWIGGDKGLFRKGKDEDFERIDLKEPSGKRVLHISSIMEDSRQNLWITAWEQGLFRYDIKNKKLYSYIDPVLRNANVVFEDANHSIWVGTWGKGLLKLNNPYTSESMHYKQYIHDEKNSYSLLDDIIYDIEQDNEHRLWIGSRSGLSILCNEQDTNSFENFVPDGEYGSLPYNEVSSILRTRDNLMWISMFGGGFCKIQTESNKYGVDNLEIVKEKYKTNSVRSICQAGDNEFWMGIIGFGMIKYNLETQNCVNYVDIPEFKSLSYTSTVDAIIKRKNGEICFGTWNAGLWFYNETDRKITLLNQYVNRKFKDDCIHVLREDSEGNLWIGTRKGVYILDAQGQFYTLSEWLHFDTDLVSSNIFDIKEDQEKNIWIATNYEGVSRINLSTRQYKKYAVNGKKEIYNTNCLLVDSHQRIWVGTMWSGLAYYQKETDSFVTVSSISTIENKGILNILEDDNGRIWITTNSAVLSFEVNDSFQMEKINYYTVSNGTSEFFFNKNASFKMPDGRIIFGGSQGLRIFESSQVAEDAPLSYSLVLTDFRIHNQSLRDFPEKKRVKLTKYDIDYTKEITLTHDKNNFYIEFSLLNYENPQENLYSYQLEGYDEKEVVVDAQQHFAIYNNLPAGTYTFRLKGTSENGVWSKQEKALIIHILPEPWKSWWAYSLYVLVGITLLYFVVRFIRYRWRMQHEIQISKLEKQKIEEINHVKLQFFTNITHELMTPLSIILASLENLKNNIGDQSSLHSIMSSNAIRLMRLIQQVLEFRKVESGNLKICVSSGNISMAIKSCVEAFAPLVGKKELKIDFLSEPETIIGYYDSDKLDKIVYNLLSNAAKYTPEKGEINVNIKLIGDSKIMIEVINTGELMSKGQINNLFQRFYEGDYRKYHTIGTGIGLSLVKDLVEKHHGEISVHSEENIGNCFRIILPITKDSYQSDEIDDSVKSQIVSSLPFITCDYETNHEELERIDDIQSDYTILIVDDNEELCMLFSNLFTNYFHVETAFNGKQGLEVLNNTTIDLIVSDIMMPEMDGIEFCQTVKNKFEFCHIPVILLTARGTEESQIEGYNSGADGYISKPCNFSLLYAQIMNLLKKQERKGADFRKQLVFEVGKLEYTSMDESFIQRAIDCVNSHLGDCEFGQPEFVREMGTSRTVLTEKLKSLTGLTPSIFILNVRLTAACKLLEEQKRMRIADLAYSVGFNDPKYFSTCFKKKYSLSPKEYMDRLQS